MENERLECEIKVSLRYHSACIDIIRRNYTRCCDIVSFSYSDVGVICYKYILFGGHKFADADPTGSLDSCSGTKNEQKNNQNTVIEDKIRTFSAEVYRVPPHAKPMSKNFAIIFESFPR